MIFINSPFTILDEAFRGLYPDKKYKACIEPNIKDDEGNRAFGFTQFNKQAKDVLWNQYLTCHPTYKITAEGMCTLTVNGNTMTANVGQNLTIDTDRMIAYRSDGTLNNTQVKGNYEDMYLLNGENEISFSGGELKVIPNWRCL